MTAISNLSVLLRNLTPALQEGEYVYCSIPGGDTIAPGETVCLFTEKEGMTAILKKEQADLLHIPYVSVFSWITLNVYSSLEAVGLTAVFSTALAKQGISCNVVAAFYHDHIFVPVQDAEKAMAVLRSLSEPNNNFINP